MRNPFLLRLGSATLVLLVAAAQGMAQPPDAGKGAWAKGPQGPLDEEREILKEIKEAYKAPFEVHKDVLGELRKSYEQPTPQREAKIFKELRRMYNLSDQQEATLLREIRMTYERPSADQEDRIFKMIQRMERLPEGAVPAAVQVDQARKIFRKLDLDNDGVLNADEMPDSLRGQRGRWDANRDGVIDFDEYWSYYQGRLGSLGDQVAAGEIDLKLGRMAPPANATPSPVVEARPAVFRAGKLPPGLPDWFVQLDTDRDGQIGLYEWTVSGRPLDEFRQMDRNDDGFVTIDELRFYLSKQPGNRANGAPGAGSTTAGTTGKR